MRVAFFNGQFFEYRLPNDSSTSCAPLATWKPRNGQGVR